MAVQFKVQSNLLLHLSNVVNSLSSRSLEKGLGPIILATIKYRRRPEPMVLVRIIGSGEFFEQACQIAKITQDEKTVTLLNTNIESVLVGQPGEEFKLILDLHTVTSFMGDYGITYVHRFKDDSGNELVWLTKKKTESGKYKVKGKIKQHSEYNGVKETRIKNCKLEKL